jgi:hypothetical protein
MDSVDEVDKVDDSQDTSITQSNTDEEQKMERKNFISKWYEEILLILQRK